MWSGIWTSKLNTQSFSSSNIYVVFPVVDEARRKTLENKIKTSCSPGLPNDINTLRCCSPNCPGNCCYQSLLASSLSSSLYFLSLCLGSLELWNPGPARQRSLHGGSGSLSWYVVGEHKRDHVAVTEGRGKREAHVAGEVHGGWRAKKTFARWEGKSVKPMMWGVMAQWSRGKPAQQGGMQWGSRGTCALCGPREACGPCRCGPCGMQPLDTGKLDSPAVIHKLPKYRNSLSNFGILLDDMYSSMILEKLAAAVMHMKMDMNTQMRMPDQLNFLQW